MRAGNRKQAIVPEGATILEPVGHGARARRRRRRRRRARRSLVLPGPAARAAADVGDARWRREPLRAVLDRAGALEQRMLRLFGIPESEIARDAARDRGATASRSTGSRSRPACGAARSRSPRSSSPAAAAAYDAFAAGVRERHGDALFSEDGATIDEQVAALLDGPHDRASPSRARAGCWPARLTDRAGSSRVRARRRGRLLQRGQGRARRRARRR